MTSIFDADGQERDLVWLQTKYGNVRYLTPENEGDFDKVFRLTRIDVTRGPAVIQVGVFRDGFIPHGGQPVANHWPDKSLPTLKNIGLPVPSLPTLYKEMAIVKSTEANGFVGFGLGNGSYIGNLAEGGPHTVWVLSPTYPSDGLTGVGMLGGTEHEGPLRLTFTLQNTAAVVAPPPSPPAPVDNEDTLLLRRLVHVTEALARHLGVTVWPRTL